MLNSKERKKQQKGYKQMKVDTIYFQKLPGHGKFDILSLFFTHILLWEISRMNYKKLGQTKNSQRAKEQGE